MPTECQGNYENVIENSDYCYKAYRTSLSWKKASSFCQETGDSLVQINDGVENTELLKFANARGISSGKVWLGLKQTGGNTEWAWQPKGISSKWTAWSGGQPDNKRGEDCGSMSVSNNGGAWFDDHCELEQPFICMSSKISKLLGFFQTKIYNIQTFFFHLLEPPCFDKETNACRIRQRNGELEDYCARGGKGCDASCGAC